jgi:hypothetical protein
MKITIKTSGGIGGFGLSPEPTDVDVKSLPAALQKRARAAFAKGRLQSLAKKPGNPHAADTIGYEITVAHDSGERERAELSEDKLSDDILDLIDEIKSAGR